MSCEVLLLQGVHGWQPDRITPCKVEAEVIVSDVDRA